MPRKSLVVVDEMTERQQQIAALRLQGWTQEQIAKEIGRTQQTVSAELRRIREIWKSRAAESYDAHVAEAQERYDWALRELSPKIESGSIAAIEAFIRLEDRRARLLGIDKPVEQKVTISIEAIDNRIAELEAKASAVELDYIEGEIVEDSAE